MPEYRVQIEIDVDAKDEQAAARQAWDLLSGTGYEPVVDVFDVLPGGKISNNATRVDLSEEPV